MSRLYASSFRQRQKGAALIVGLIMLVLITIMVTSTFKLSTSQLQAVPGFLRAHDRNATPFAIRPGMSLAEVEKLLIRQTLTHVTENREEAAKLLGISRRSLQYKLKQYGLLDEPESAEEE
jgi:DNA-binding protein Fis